MENALCDNKLKFNSMKNSERGFEKLNIQYIYIYIQYIPVVLGSLPQVSHVFFLFYRSTVLLERRRAVENSRYLKHFTA